MIPSCHEFEEIMIQRHTRGVYDRLKHSRAAVAGLGGLGSNIAISLARAGVGELLLVDFDRVDLSNLNRQQYEIGDIGRYKTEALAERLSRINPYINVISKTVHVTEDNAAELFGSYGVLCEAFDKAEAKAMLCQTVLAECPETTVISGSGMAGVLSANSIVTKKALSRLYICGDGVTDMADANGLMAPRVAVCANHQANMALRLMLGEKEV
jgi:sulfur carrier protein ThiS adenylyltransferase